ncbi:hypothetical protein OBBRIDRAFT_796955 [Obba rivulosa]|uniref:Uncharacterized protein n=1 Tax=Obba rivulosa TaxID=1052685 RepID=A0A8E2DH70_9APHY|nr:hypothetical protein OBBRIDRAFT_796955 [Obba rivulosa]
MQGKQKFSTGDADGISEESGASNLAELQTSLVDSNGDGKMRKDIFTHFRAHLATGLALDVARAVLPVEHIQRIFEFAVLPSGYLDPSLYTGQESMWLRTLRFKKKLI